MHTEYHETTDNWALVQVYDENPYIVHITGQETADYPVDAGDEFAVNVRQTDIVEIVQNGQIISLPEEEGQ